MIRVFLHSLMTFLDLLALTTLTGSVLCGLWIVRTAGGDAADIMTFRKRLHRLLMLCLVSLVISSTYGLLQRSMEMSGVGITAIFPVLPTILFKTHYGSMWFLRLGGFFAAVAVWWVGRRHIGTVTYAVSLLFAVAVIAFTRSASGHPADFGDLSPQQLADWMHFLSVSSWAGVLFALAIVFPPSPVADEDSSRQRIVAGVADRFYLLFGPVLAMVVLTGLYNAWFAVESFNALFTTAYGGLLSAKLLLFFMLVFRYITPPEHGNDEALFTMKFLRRTRVEALVVLLMLICVALLVHRIPARHQVHLDHIATAEAHAKNAAAEPEPVVSLETTPSRITVGIPVAITVKIKDPDGRPFKGLVLSHERILHAIIIGKDLNVFAHIHPEDIGPIADEMMQKATFPLIYSFPKVGEYIVGFDFAAGDDSYSKTVHINVGDAPGMGEPSTDFSTIKNFGEYRVVLTISPEPVSAGKETTLSYFIEKGGKPVQDLQPYLGASMHLAVVPMDLKLFIHAHGMAHGEQHTDHMHAAPPKRFGPGIEADIIFPVKGTYKIFSQVKHQGRVLLFDFMVNVQ